MTLNNENNNECCKCTTPEYTINLNQQGPQGRQGNPGKDGFSPSITVNTSSDDAYILQIETKDGTILTPNLKAAFPSDGEANSILVNDGTNHPFWTGNINNLVTTDTYQTITASKTFESNLTYNGSYLYTYNLDENGLSILAMENWRGDSANDTSLQFGTTETPLTLRGSVLDYVDKSGNYNYILHQGNVTAGENVTITKTANGVQISSTTEPYTLSPATTTTLGGIKVGENLTITEDGTLNATGLPDNVLTSDNISQDAYIQQLETRIAALEALIDGGNATND